MRFFVHSFQGWCKISVFEKNLVKKGFPKKNNCAPFFLGSLGLVHCCCMMSLDALEGCAKKPYKNRFFLAHPVARCRRNRKKKKKKGPKKKVTPKKWGLQNGQEVVPPFFSKKTGFSKTPKTPIFIAFPEKWVATIFLEKGYVTKRTDLEGKKQMITFWCLLDRNV